MSDKEIFHSEAIYGMKTKQPLVKITFRSEEVMISTDEARQIAKDLLDTAHASDGDAFLVEWLTEKLDIPVERAVVALRDFREHRVIKRIEREANR